MFRTLFAVRELYVYTAPSEKCVMGDYPFNIVCKKIVHSAFCSLGAVCIYCPKRKMCCGQFNCELYTSKVFFNFVFRHFYQNRPAVRAVSDIGIVQELFDKFIQLVFRCSVAGFDGGTASG